jgi:hypothetical protein
MKLKFRLVGHASFLETVPTGQTPDFRSTGPSFPAPPIFYYCQRMDTLLSFYFLFFFYKVCPYKFTVNNKDYSMPRKKLFDYDLRYKKADNFN